MTGRARLRLETQRVSRDEALEWLLHTPLAELVARADALRRARHGRRTVFTHSLNLNPTNLCENRCELCAFWREPHDSDAYLLELDDARRRFDQVAEWGLTDLHVVGGVTDRLNLAYYEALFRLAREKLPGVLVQGLTAVEIHALARREGLTVRTVLKRLQAAGLGAVPGGGAEIFSPAIRRRICSVKITARQWLAVHAQAHGLGLPTNATLLFGHVEKPRDIVDHLARLRDLQDRTGGFQAFIALPFHPRGARLEVSNGPCGDRITRVVALARIFLDNFPHVRVLANYTDTKLLHVLTHAGADDVGPTSLDERIAKAAGAPPDHGIVSIRRMEAMLTDLGLEPVLVNSAYRPAGPGHGANAPRAATVRGSCPPSTDHTEVVPSILETTYCTFGGSGSVPTGLSPGNSKRKRLAGLLGKAASGGRLSADEAVTLHDAAPMGALGMAAHRRRLRLCDPATATFVIDRNISLTNVCVAECRFCAFHVRADSPHAFVLTVEQIVRKVEEARRLGATQVMIQGGLNPQLDLAFYEQVLRAIKRQCDVWVHSLSPAEVAYLADGAGLTLRQCLVRLREAGLDSLPGGGAEILVEEVRQRVSPRKISARRWLAVMEAAHGLGMNTTATMVYGLGETPAQRVRHLLALRELQDRTSGFTAFIPWSFQPNRTRLERRPGTGVDYLRIVALSRLVLDNVPHIQAGWVTEGPDVAQLALSFGADDFGGVLMEEKVVRATGVRYAVTPGQVAERIRQAGFKPARRTTRYEIIANV